MPVVGGSIILSERTEKMEDVLEVYQRPYDPLYPVVCIDETNKQLIEETRYSISEDRKDNPCY